MSAVLTTSVTIQRCTYRRKGAKQGSWQKLAPLSPPTSRCNRHIDPAARPHSPEFSPSRALTMLNPQASTFSVGERGLADRESYLSKAALHKKKSSGNVKVFIDKEKVESSQLVNTRGQRCSCVTLINTRCSGSSAPSRNSHVRLSYGPVDRLQAMLPVRSKLILYSFTAPRTPLRSSLPNNHHHVSSVSECLSNQDLMFRLST